MPTKVANNILNFVLTGFDEFERKQSMGESSLLYHFAFAAVRSNLHVSACFMRVFLIELMNGDSMTNIIV